MEFNVNILSSRNDLIIYGAGIFGEYTKKALNEIGINPTCFCDRKKAGTQYEDLHVISPKELVDKYKDAIILIAVGVEFSDVYNWLQAQEFNNIYTVKDLIFNTDFSLKGMSVQAQDKNYYKALYEWGIATYYAKDELKISNLDWVITQRCSLKCKNCSNLMPYYKDPHDYLLDEIKTHLENFLYVIDEIMDLRILGGEPFMNKNIDKFIEFAIGLPKIKNITIYTNATILPDNNTVKVLKDKKVRMEITNYGEIAKNFNKFVQIVNAEHIRHNIVELSEWHDLGNLCNRNLSEHERETVYSKCYCRNTPTLLEGKLFRCPYSANGRILKAIPYKNQDFCDFTFKTLDIQKTRIDVKNLIFNSLSDYACGFCSGRNNHIATVIPAIQTNQQLYYEKYE